MKVECFQHILKKYLLIKFHENPSSWSPNVPCGRTDMTKFVVAFRSVVKAPKTQADEGTTVTSEETTSSRVQFSQHTAKNEPKHR
jgi:hypothetical protein